MCNTVYSTWFQKDIIFHSLLFSTILVSMTYCKRPFFFFFSAPVIVVVFVSCCVQCIVSFLCGLCGPPERPWRLGKNRAYSNVKLSVYTKDKDKNTKLQLISRDGSALYS